MLTANARTDARRSILIGWPQFRRSGTFGGCRCISAPKILLYKWRGKYSMELNSNIHPFECNMTVQTSVDYLLSLESKYVSKLVEFHISLSDVGRRQRDCIALDADLANAVFESISFDEEMGRDDAELEDDICPEDSDDDDGSNCSMESVLEDDPPLIINEMDVRQVFWDMDVRRCLRYLYPDFTTDVPSKGSSHGDYHVEPNLCVFRNRHTDFCVFALKRLAGKDLVSVGSVHNWLIYMKDCLNDISNFICSEKFEEKTFVNMRFSQQESLRNMGRHILNSPISDLGLYGKEDIAVFAAQLFMTGVCRDFVENVFGCTEKMNFFL